MSPKILSSDCKVKSVARRRIAGNPSHLIRWLFPCIFFFSACGFNLTTPAEEKAPDEETVEEGSFSQIRKSPSTFYDSLVDWGGEIVDIKYLVDGTELCILETPVEYWDKPEWKKHSKGRFIARCEKLVNEDIFKIGTKVTVSGRITGVEKRAFGQAGYLYPVVRVIHLHLWKKYRYWPHYYDFWRWYSREGSPDAAELPFNEPGNIDEIPQ